MITKRAIEVLKEFNISFETLVNTLKRDGVVPPSSPTDKISEEAYLVLQREFDYDKKIREMAEEKLKHIKEQKSETISIENMDKQKGTKSIDKIDNNSNDSLKQSNIHISYNNNKIMDAQNKINSGNQLDESNLNNQPSEATQNDRNIDDTKAPEKINDERIIIEKILRDKVLLKQICDTIFEVTKINKNAIDSDDFQDYLSSCNLRLPYFYEFNKDYTIFYVRNYERLLQYLLSFKNNNYYPITFDNGIFHFINEEFKLHNYSLTQNNKNDLYTLNIKKLIEINEIDNDRIFIRFHLYSSKDNFSLTMMQDEYIKLNIKWKKDKYSSSYWGLYYDHEYFFCYNKHNGKKLSELKTSYLDKKNEFISQCKKIAIDTKPLKFNNPLTQVLYGLFNNIGCTIDIIQEYLNKMNELLLKYNFYIHLEQNELDYFPRIIKANNDIQQKIIVGQTLKNDKNNNQIFNKIDLNDVKSILDENIFHQLEKRLNEAKVSYMNECYLASIVQIGSILEGICFSVFQKITNHNPSQKLDAKLKEQISKCLNEANPVRRNEIKGDYLTLEDVIDYLKNKGILTEMTSQYTMLLKMLRNLVHPFHRSFEYPDKNKNEIAFLLLEDIIKSIKKRYNNGISQ